LKDADRHTAKILDLFRHRHIDWLWARSAQAGHRDAYATLMRIQSAIYDLDAYLESHWRLSRQRLESYWQALEGALSGLVPDPADQTRLLEDIRQYQAQELMTRSGGDISLIPLDDFYYYKTCDVRLIRELILRSDPPLRDAIPATCWLAFDRITELEDDIEDQSEDQGTYNVNRYLAAARSLGASRAAMAYRTYSDALLEKALGLDHASEFPFRAEWESWMIAAHRRLASHLDQVP
jgi:hypothetical protein